MLSMPRPALLPVLIREIFGARSLPREPEPDLVMDDEDQVTAFAEAGRADGVMAANYLFHSARITQVIQGCRRVVDLGCGPATQLAQVAELNPGISFLGLDLSQGMLTSAEAHLRELGLTNVELDCRDITRLDHIPERSVDGVISTLTLHHLPTIEHLETCFREITRVLKPPGALYLADFGRLKSLKSVIFFAYMNREHQPHIFSLDFERSLRAAFCLEDFQRLATQALAPHAHVYSTFKAPLLTIVKSEDRPLLPELPTRLKSMRRALPPRYRRDLDDLRFFLRLGGLKGDPF